MGEVQVRGPWVAASYYGGRDAERFEDGWFRTGDVAVGRPDGTFQIVDRTKDVIKSGGEWISSVELENTILDHPAVREAAVVARPDVRWSERPVACVVLREGCTLSLPELGGWLEQRVPRFWVPDDLVLLDELPKTSVGKLDKKVMRAQYAREAATTG
jgi:fatty-acyl-CoA synthase